MSRLTLTARQGLHTHRTATSAPQRRASAYGLFTAGYGVFWFLGSAVMGVLYDHSVAATVVFCVALQLAAMPVFFIVHRQNRHSQR